MYIKSSLAFDRLYPDAVGIELLIVCVSSYKSSSKLCLAVYYRPPSSSVDSFGFLSSALMSLNPTVFDHFILLGDFNVNYFCSSSSLYSHLTYSLTPFHLTQIITSGTHVDHSGNSTLINPRRAHAQRGLRYLVCVSVCLCVCVSVCVCVCLHLFSHYRHEIGS